MSLKAYLSIRLTVEQSGTLPTDGRKDNIILHTVLTNLARVPAYNAIGTSFLHLNGTTSQSESNKGHHLV